MSLGSVGARAVQLRRGRRPLPSAPAPRTGVPAARRRGDGRGRGGGGGASAAARCFGPRVEQAGFAAVPAGLDHAEVEVLFAEDRTTMETLPVAERRALVFPRRLRG